MTKIECNAKTCGYNDCNRCNKRNIDVEGLFAKSKIGTFCQSFKNPHDSQLLMKEIAREMTTEDSVSISCNYCEAKEIRIGNEDAKYRSETQCDSFKLR